jgi:hypothetical protein
MITPELLFYSRGLLGDSWGRDEFPCLSCVCARGRSLVSGRGLCCSGDAGFFLRHTMTEESLDSPCGDGTRSSSDSADEIESAIIYSEIIQIVGTCQNSIGCRDELFWGLQLTAHIHGAGFYTLRDYFMQVGEGCEITRFSLFRFRLRWCKQVSRVAVIYNEERQYRCGGPTRQDRPGLPVANFNNSV